MAKHDPSHIGQPPAETLGEFNRPQTGRQAELASWKQQEAEAAETALELAAKHGRRWTVRHGWAWKGYGFTLQLQPEFCPEPPTESEILASVRPKENA